MCRRFLVKQYRTVYRAGIEILLNNQLQGALFFIIRAVKNIKSNINTAGFCQMLLLRIKYLAPALQ
jgi:hypothetical protein